MILRIAGSLFLPALLQAGCGGPPAPPGAPARESKAPAGSVVFTDVTKQAGIAFVHNSGAFGKKYLPETMGSGVVFFDYDGDGRPDLFFVNSCDWPEHHRRTTTPALYRNRGDGTFEDVTRKAGLAVEIYGIGAAAADYDNDGHTDLFVNALGPDRLFHNRGDGTFEDVTRASGLLDPTGKSLGVVAFDFDGDGWTDLAVANDTQPNLLYRNRHDGTFEEIGKTAGVAFSEEGKARGAMGIDAADYDGSGRQSLVIGNFSNEMMALYHNEGRGLFIDDAATAGIGQPSLLTLAFGCFFFDYDLDGRLDIFVANGHVENDINRVPPSVTYAQPPHLFRGMPGGRFEETTALAGEALRRALVARGAAYADIDGDGDLDVALSTNNGPALLLRNDGGAAGRWIRLLLVGRGANRDAIGAVVRLLGGSDRGAARAGAEGRAIEAVREVRSASSYASQSERVITLGLEDRPGPGAGPGPGGAAPVEVEVTWPDGKRQTFSGLVPNRLHLLEEAP